MMTMPEIERCLRQLRLSGVRDTLQTRVLQAQGANQPFLETFSLICGFRRSRPCIPIRSRPGIPI
ncbi:hypothetical protein ACVMFA_000241 [Bradyrhizobium liaoningense]